MKRCSASLVLAAAKSLQSCPTLCNPTDSSPPGSPVPGILQARTLAWVAISFSNAWKWKVKVKSLSRVQLLVTPWTAAYQAPPSMGFSKQEYWSGSLVLRERQIKCTMKLSPHINQNGHLKKPTTINSAEGVEKGMLLHYGWEYKLVQPLERTVQRFLKD